MRTTTSPTGRAHLPLLQEIIRSRKHISHGAPTRRAAGSPASANGRNQTAEPQPRSDRAPAESQPRSDRAPAERCSGFRAQAGRWRACSHSTTRRHRRLRNLPSPPALEAAKRWCPALPPPVPLGVPRKVGAHEPDVSDLPERAAAASSQPRPSARDQHRGPLLRAAPRPVPPRSHGQRARERAVARQPGSRGYLLHQRPGPPRDRVPWRCRLQVQL